MGSGVEGPVSPRPGPPTHVVVAVRLPGLHAHVGDVGPAAVAVGVALDEVVGGLPGDDPVAQELPDTSGVDHSVAGGGNAAFNQWE